MIDRQPKSSYLFGYGLSFYLVSSALIMSATMSSSVAEDAAIKSPTVAMTREVSFAETIKQTNDSELGEIVPIGDLVVTVGRGESLSSILRKNLGSLSALKVVTNYNKLDAPDTLEPGQEILIPGYLFPGWSDTQPVQLVISPVTVAVAEGAMPSPESEEQYLVVDLTELSLSTDPENVTQSAQSEEQYLVVDLTELSLAADPENVTQSAQSEEQYLVVDLTDVNTTPDRTVRVNRGDTLSSILRENLGSLRALREVTRYNNLDTPDVLKPGQIIRIPGYL